MTDGPVRWLHLVVEPAFFIDTIYTKNSEFTTVDHWFKALDQLETLIFKIISSSSRDKQKGKTVVAVGSNWHFFPQGRTVPGRYFSSHFFCIRIIEKSDCGKRISKCIKEMLPRQ